MPETILVVEDEAALRESLAYTLTKEGFAVQAVDDGRAAVEAAPRLQPDLIILDIMLPGLDGFEVCRLLRKDMTTPILMLTARDDEIDRVVGLEVGADDYLTKPFSMRELVARVKAQLRRARLAQAPSTATEIPAPEQTRSAGNLVLNLTRHEALLDGEVLQLRPKEFELLAFLMENRGKMLSRELILQRVWGWDFIGNSRTVDVHVRWLREKIENDAARPERIVTVRGSGYRFES